jgi:hypothetical protein
VAEFAALVDDGPELAAAGCQSIPFGLRRPVANRCPSPLAASNSKIAARPVSASTPFSPTLLFDPTVAKSFVPSQLATMFLVQW